MVDELPLASTPTPTDVIDARTLAGFQAFFRRHAGRPRYATRALDVMLANLRDKASSHFGSMLQVLSVTELIDDKGVRTGFRISYGVLLPKQRDAAVDRLCCDHLAEEDFKFSDPEPPFSIAQTAT